MKSFLTTFFVFLTVFFFFVLPTNAGDPEAMAQKYDITFPITELGGCENYAGCRTYCEDSLNSEACISFAKKKGFYKEENLDTRKDEIMQRAKDKLGCDSFEACKNFCEISTNQDKCDSFARETNLSGGYVEDPGKREIVEKAKEVFGCDSYASCASFCSQSENREKCSTFAQQNGLRGGERPVGPGGCTTEETCKVFCSDPQNYKICSGFASSSGGNFQGPGGCNSEESCRTYCSTHEDECRNIGSAPPPGYDMQEMCNKTQNCAWKDNTCQCGTYPTATSGQVDPASECARYGCSWTENSCQCSSQYSPPQNNTNYPAPTYVPYTSPEGSGTSPGGYSGNAVTLGVMTVLRQLALKVVALGPVALANAQPIPQRTTLRQQIRTITILPLPTRSLSPKTT